ncbi:MAG TPA: hypothetical protein VNL13_08035, partial [Sulfolobales archaeon]|nr:hypothetical protein [Sulfolobales archaeon]
LIGLGNFHVYWGMPGGYFPTNTWVSISLERYCPRCWVSPHKSHGNGSGAPSRLGHNLDGSPIPLGSTAAHDLAGLEIPVGRGGSPWIRP